MTDQLPYIAEIIKTNSSQFGPSQLLVYHFLKTFEGNWIYKKKYFWLIVVDFELFIFSSRTFI